MTPGVAALGQEAVDRIASSARKPNPSTSACKRRSFGSEPRVEPEVEVFHQRLCLGLPHGAPDLRRLAANAIFDGIELADAASKRIMLKWLLKNRVNRQQIRDFYPARNGRSTARGATFLQSKPSRRTESCEAVNEITPS
jgi:hypothetical protein